MASVSSYVLQTVSPLDTKDAVLASEYLGCGGWQQNRDGKHLLNNFSLIFGALKIPT